MYVCCWLELICYEYLMITFSFFPITNVGMTRIVHLHHVNKGAFLKGNVEPDLDELALVFESSLNYVEVLDQVRKELNWMDPSDTVVLEGRHNVGFGHHIR